jgi:pimeloyl-ACP methyl ester carboxylesterase
MAPLQPLRIPEATQARTVAMPLIHVTDSNGTPAMASGAPLRPALAALLAQYAGPIIIMIHGYKYAPGLGQHCPHASLFARQSQSRYARSASWPEQLTKATGQAPGPMIGFGWTARGSLPQAYRRAAVAGACLATLIATLRRISPNRPIHLMAHSLGARVALVAAAQLPNGAVNRILLLAAADYVSTAQMALTRPSLEVVNVTSAENALFDRLLPHFVPRPHPDDTVLGQGLKAPNALTLRLDDAATLAALGQMGFPVAKPQNWICHWSVYMRDGVFPLYAALFQGTLAVQSLPQTNRPAPRPALALFKGPPPPFRQRSA